MAFDNVSFTEGSAPAPIAAAAAEPTPLSRFDAIWALSDAELDARGLRRATLAFDHFAGNIWA
jgi:hypothetical protein